MILLQHLYVSALKQLREVELWFPAQGSILIEGKNESGKSTLFEAIFFALYGMPLTGEETRATLEDLLPHGGASVQLELALVVEETILEIRRKLMSSTATRRVVHEAHLLVRYPQGSAEEINGPQAVNARILQELHGLDGDALRNSCFMEQKGLDRIERLGHDQRDTSVAKLVGIEHLRRVEKDLREIGDEYRRAIGQLQVECEVASLRQAASKAESAAESAEECFRAAQVRLLIEERDSRILTRQAYNEQITALGAERQKLLDRLATSTGLRAIQAELGSTTRQLEEATLAEAQRSKIRTSLEQLEYIDQETLPKTARYLQALRTLETSLATVEATRAALTLAESEAAIIEAEGVLEREEQGFALAHEAASRAELQHSLTTWLDSSDLRTLGSDEADQVMALKERRRLLTVETTRAETLARRTELLVYLFAFLALASLVIGLELHYLWTLTGIFAAVGGYALWSVQQYQRQQRHAEQELRSLGIILDVAPAHAPDVPAGEGVGDFAVLQKQADEAQDRVVEQRTRLAIAQEKRALLLRAGNAAGFIPAQVSATAELSIATLRQTLQQYEEAIAAQALELGIAPEPTLVAAARTEAETEARALVEQLAARETLALQLDEQGVYAEQMQVVAQDAFRNLEQHLFLDQIEQGEQSIPAPTLDELSGLCRQLSESLIERLAAIDEESSQIGLAVANERLRTLEHQDEGEAEICVQLYEQIAEQLEEHTPPSSVHNGRESLESLASHWPLLVNVDVARLDSYEEAFRAAALEAHHLRRTTSQLERSSGLEDRELEIDVCRERLAECERSCRQYALAVEMAQQVRGRIVRRILPQTEAFMRALLPELTAGRYRDVQLLADEAGDLRADLSIRLWDEEAGRHVSKNVFSGGTRDQCSLALRLAFALATLPTELGAMPGFIFLDEPLSSFDAERRAALVQILTKGTIAKQFAQVLLISHSETFRRESFQFYVYMEAGQVSESNLPRGAVGAEAESARLSSDAGLSDVT